ncbi:MAG: RagB/SusD family nutrient uptake outer membrane protein [Mangrovibacterium sp.]|nr:RagB/SusD family nutrient uptake outer membrane protein [Mangrovibacterium sp.]
MKNMKSILILIISILFISSCEIDLDRVPESNLSDAAFWKNDRNFKEACNRFYMYVDGPNEIVLDDVRSDYAVGTTPNSVSEGTRVTPSTSDDWDKPYKIIFWANKILEKSEDVDISKINQWRGEAKFWRAYAYFNLLSKYGGVPLVLKTLDIDDDELYGGRAERAEVVQQIYDDLDFAAENLPTFTELGETDYGRASRSAALAFKARVALYEGTRQKFHGYGTPAEHLNIAIVASQTVMQEGEHNLYSKKDFYYLFQMDGEGFANKENILPAIYGEGPDNSIRSHGIMGLVFNGHNQATRTMVEQFLCTDGLPFDKSPLAVTPEEEPTPWYFFRNKDPRLQATIMLEGEPCDIRGFLYYWDSPEVKTKYAYKKYDIVTEFYTSTYVDIMILRYAEVLLSYAEAKFEKDGSISDADLNKSINLLRDRVSMPHLTNAFVAAHGLDMRNEIRRERAVELATEGFRYNDIIRWKIAEEVLPERIIGAYYFPDVYLQSTVTEDNFILVESSEHRYFNSERDYLYPIPTREIALSNGTIIQNPNW